MRARSRSSVASMRAFRAAQASGVIRFFGFIVLLEQRDDEVEIALDVPERAHDSDHILALDGQLHAPIVAEEPRFLKMALPDAAPPRPDPRRRGTGARRTNRTAPRPRSPPRGSACSTP